MTLTVFCTDLLDGFPDLGTDGLRAAHKNFLKTHFGAQGVTQLNFDRDVNNGSLAFLHAKLFYYYAKGPLKNDGKCSINLMLYAMHFDYIM